MNDTTMRRFLESRLNYEVSGMPSCAHLRLERMERLMAALGDPHRRYGVVHVAGTKGKGSTSHMIATLLERFGHCVGLHTSPHFHTVEERLRINNRAIDSAAFWRLVREIAPIVEQVDNSLVPLQPGLTYFEITTALSFLYFAQQAVDWAVIEVGMGGRLDATNVVLPDVAVITSISRDHVQDLGGQLDAIAREKAGIIKPGRPVVSGVRNDPARNVIRTVCVERGSALRELGTAFEYRYISHGWHGGQVLVRTWQRMWPALSLPLPGEHQASNAAVAIAAVDTILPNESTGLLGQGDETFSRLAVTGRIEVIAHDPLVVLDVAHNEASAAALARVLAHSPPSGNAIAGVRVLVFGVSRDKDWQAMLFHLLPCFDRVVLTRYQSNPRGLPPETMADFLAANRSRICIVAEPLAAWRRALELVCGGESQNRSSGLICIAGSFYLAAELDEIIRNHQTAQAAGSSDRSTALHTWRRQVKHATASTLRVRH